MPNVQVHDLHLTQASNTLTAGTYGRGMFQLFLTSVPGPDAAVVPGTPPPPVYGAPAHHDRLGDMDWPGHLGRRHRHQRRQLPVVAHDA